MKLSLVKFWNVYINIKEEMYFFELDDLKWENTDFPSNLSVRPYKNFKEIPSADVEQLLKLKSREVLMPFLDSFFKRYATLWLAKMDKKIVGLQWSLTGGFNGFYSLPISSKEAIFLAAEVFPMYRGLRIYSHMAHLTCLKLKEKGISRIYFKVHVTNASSLRCVSKTKSKKIGVVRTVNIFNKYITVWDKKSLLGSVTKEGSR